jgi:uncharacterized pyridoxal phosphate-containing UPF0001 family protein
VDLERLRRNLDGVRLRIDAACARAGRRSGDVALIVVTKSAPAPLIPRLADLGVTDIGESRPVEGGRRTGGLTAFRRHLIGHLQSNKIGRALAWADVVQSGDRHSLLAELARRSPKFPVYLQINISGEPSKGGFPPERLESALEAARGLKVEGLMTMAPLGGDARACFRGLRELAGRHGLQGLSMGMSQDFEAAVEEGATCVRVGSAIFEGITV